MAYVKYHVQYGTEDDVRNPEPGMEVLQDGFDDWEPACHRYTHLKQCGLPVRLLKETGVGANDVRIVLAIDKSIKGDGWWVEHEKKLNGPCRSSP